MVKFWFAAGVLIDVMDGLVVSVATVKLFVLDTLFRLTLSLQFTDQL